MCADGLNTKKLNKKARVELLEDAVLKGTLEDLRAVLQTYAPFEFTARALGLAARYRGLDFVRELISAGATFRYDSHGALAGRYDACQKTATGRYRTEYYIMLVPKKIAYHGDNARYVIGGPSYFYSPLNGVGRMDLSSKYEKHVLPLRERVEEALYLAEIKGLGVSLDDMLFWALTHGELAFADALIEAGVDLQKVPPSYFPTSAGSYLNIITLGEQSIYWTDYVIALTKLKKGLVLPVLERIKALADACGTNRPVLNQKMFDEIQWTDEALRFAFRYFDCTRVNRKKALYKAASEGRIDFLSLAAEEGWLAQKAKREDLIAFARDNKHMDALAWLLDFKNRTVDFAAEAAAEEKKMMAEFTQAPDSAAALKKTWSWKKQDDGTLVITSYKGNDLFVSVPAVIGRAKVTAIGPYALSGDWNGPFHKVDNRKAIVKVTVPEGISVIGDHAFSRCEKLEWVSLPASLREIGHEAFYKCPRLKKLELPEGIQSFGQGIFWGCEALADKDGFIIRNGILFAYFGKGPSIRIPETVRIISSARAAKSGYGYSEYIQEISLPDSIVEIGPGAFEDFSGLVSVSLPLHIRFLDAGAFSSCWSLQSVFLNGALEEIAGRVFFCCFDLEEIRIPESVKRIGDSAFYGCSGLREFYISAGTEKLGDRIFGDYDSPDANVRVHTPAGSYAEEYMKKYDSLSVVHDYPEADMPQ